MLPTIRQISLFASALVICMFGFVGDLQAQCFRGKQPIRSAIRQLFNGPGSCSIEESHQYMRHTQENGVQVQQSIHQFAKTLDNSRGIFHDSSYVGRENVYKSSGVATKADAVRAWMNSPGHRANMPYIRNIVCTGGTCVGR